MASAPPTIFSAARRAAVRRRAASRQQRNGAVRWLIEEAAQDIADRLSFLRITAHRALVLSDRPGALRSLLARSGVEVTDGSAWDDERPFPAADFDVVVSLFRLDTANDVPGALIHLRAALAPGGVMFATLLGAGSFPALRAAMQAADGERPAPRIHPQVDVRGAGQLLMRARFADPVVDTVALTREFAGFGSLIAELRDQGLTSQLATRTTPVTRAGHAHLHEAPAVRERFEILTLTGRRH